MMNSFISLDNRRWTTKSRLAASFFFFIIYLFFQQCQSLPDLRSITANNHVWLIAPKWGLGNDWKLNKSSFSASGHIKRTSNMGAPAGENAHKHVFWGGKKDTGWQCGVKKKPKHCGFRVFQHSIKSKWNVIPCFENASSRTVGSAFAWKHSSFSKTNNSAQY